MKTPESEETHYAIKRCLILRARVHLIYYEAGRSRPESALRSRKQRGAVPLCSLGFRLRAQAQATPHEASISENLLTFHKHESFETIHGFVNSTKPAIDVAFQLSTERC